MKIITLFGADKSGKTTLIDYTYNQLLSKFDGKILIGRTVEGADKKDFKALIEYSGKKIAFCSIGDPADEKHLPSEYILSGLVFASENEADVLINAYSESFFDIRNGVSTFSEATYKSIVVVDSNIFVPILMKGKLSSGKQQLQIQEQFKNIFKEL